MSYSVCSWNGAFAFFFFLSLNINFPCTAIPEISFGICPSHFQSFFWVRSSSATQLLIPVWAYLNLSNWESIHRHLFSSKGEKHFYALGFIDNYHRVLMGEIRTNIWEARSRKKQSEKTQVQVPLLEPWTKSHLKSDCLGCFEFVKL